MFHLTLTLQDGLTCGDEARADGRSDFVAFLRAVQCGVDEALQRSRGDTSVFRTLVMEVFDQFDASAGKAVAPAAQRAPLLPDEGSKRLKFSSARATLRVKTTVEVQCAARLQKCNRVTVTKIGAAGGAEAGGGGAGAGGGSRSGCAFAETEIEDHVLVVKGAVAARGHAGARTSQSRARRDKCDAGLDGGDCSGLYAKKKT